MSATEDRRSHRTSAGPVHLGSGLSLQTHIRFFIGDLPTPRFMTGALILFAVTRLALAGWRLADAALVVVLVLAYPFIEWSIHRFVLHLQPRTIAGRKIDPGIARNHRDHHRHPAELAKNLSDTGRNMITVYVGAAIAGFALTRDVRLTIDAVVYAATVVLIYEWAHYLMHSAYRSRGVYLRTIRRNHLRHHYRNENYWWGVATNVADVVLRTSPGPDTVDLVTTARDPDPPPEAVGD